MTKKIIDLQMFADGDPVQGSKIIFALRLLSKQTEENAKVLAWQTEGSRSISKDADTVKTKGGTVRVPGAAEVEYSLTSLVPKGDATIEEYQDAMMNDEKFEMWKINMDEAGSGENSGKFKAEYAQGFITSIEESSNSEDFAELSIDFGGEQKPQHGYATLTAEQQEMAQYVFEDVLKKSAA
ncbi:phage major tail protein, TP901-1 family [Faecalibaculum rodentium]|uniref:phage major tail protein, TP901-1 family n=1 Tax=Faecalibaculum rodentium TaxID=1702221 RepID=UPI0023F27D6D|nr:phage major tail protein, TP901-1 family [Faecalibaculum rodentium]